MSEPTLQDCINYMRYQIKQMEKHPRNYEFNLPYYRKTVELLEKAQRPHGEWVPGREIGQMWTGDKFVAIDYEDFSCSCCGVVVEESTEPEWNFCPNCGADMREGDNK